LVLHFDHNGPLAVALALAAGILGHAVSRHMRLPSIVLLLVLGALLGPDVSGIVQPGALGDGLQHVVGFAVAVILFEGGMRLDVGRLRPEQRAIRQLVTLGALVSPVAGAEGVRRRAAEPMKARTRLRRWSEVALVVAIDREGEVEDTLARLGWTAFDGLLPPSRPKGARKVVRAIRE
jgi:hypothetical protein